MGSFHSSRAWSKLAKEHKINRCDDCSTTADIESGHILAASRFPAARLWKSNLKYQCKPCNLKQGVKLRFNLITIKLLSIYYMVKLGKWLLTGLLAVILGRYAYLDVSMNDSIITDHIKSEVISLTTTIGTLIQEKLL